MGIYLPTLLSTPPILILDPPASPIDFSPLTPSAADLSLTDSPALSTGLISPEVPENSQDIYMEEIDPPLLIAGQKRRRGE